MGPRTLSLELLHRVDDPRAGPEREEVGVGSPQAGPRLHAGSLTLFKI